MRSVAKSKVGAIAGIVGVIVFARAYHLGNVLYEGNIILLGNDPFIVRARVETLVATANGLLDPQLLTSVPAETVQPLFTSLLAWIIVAVGGGKTIGGVILGIYPVIAALITCAAIYKIGYEITSDVRVGVAAVLVLAVFPAHVMRTAVGFSDHHAFDYVLLALTALCLVSIATTTESELRTRRTLTYSVAFGITLSSQLLAWQGGVLLAVPIALYVFLRPISDLRASISPLTSLIPIAGGLLVAAVLTLTAHGLFGWQLLPVALIPVLLFAGTVVTAAVGKLCYENSISQTVFFGIELLGSGLIAAALWTQPIFQSFISGGLAYFSTRQDSNIGETQPLIGDWAGILAGPISLFGLGWFFGVAFLLYVSWKVYQSHKPQWLVATVYTWYFLILSVFVQRRFTGELSPFLAIFTGAAVLLLLDKLGIVEDFSMFESSNPIQEIQVPSPSSLAYFAFIFLLISGTLMIPQWVGLLTHSTDLHDSAEWMESHADDRDWEYPENYVFGQSLDNPMVNYFVNEEPTYWYARQRFPAFLAATNGTEWYHTLRDRDYYNSQYRGPIGFIMTQDRDQTIGQQSMYSRLHHSLGSRNGTTPGLAHYRLVHQHSSGSPKVFTIVEGAKVVGTTSTTGFVEMDTNITVSNTSFEYTRLVRARAGGEFNTTVPYPGTYSIGNHSVTVSEQDVINGSVVRASPSS